MTVQTRATVLPPADLLPEGARPVVAIHDELYAAFCEADSAAEAAKDAERTAPSRYEAAVKRAVEAGDDTSSIDNPMLTAAGERIHAETLRDHHARKVYKQWDDVQKALRNAAPAALVDARENVKGAEAAYRKALAELDGARNRWLEAIGDIEYWRIARDEVWNLPNYPVRSGWLDGFGVASDVHRGRHHGEVIDEMRRANTLVDGVVPAGDRATKACVESKSDIEIDAARRAKVVAAIRK